VASVIGSFVGAGGSMTSAQVQHLQQNVCDIFNHGWEHIGPHYHTEAEVERDMLLMNEWMLRNGFNGYRFHATPGGHWGYPDLYKKYFHNARDVGWPNTYPPLIYQVHGRPVEGTTTVETVKGWIDRTKERAEWLIFCFHGIETGWDPWPAANLLEIVNYIKAEGIPVKTMSEAMKAIL